MTEDVQTTKICDESLEVNNYKKHSFVNKQASWSMPILHRAPTRLLARSAIENSLRLIYLHLCSFIHLSVYLVQLGDGVSLWRGMFSCICTILLESIGESEDACHLQRNEDNGTQES